MSEAAASNNALAMFSGIVSHSWAYPALEVVHIFGIALLVGNLMLLELRVWGLGAALPVPALARLSLGIALIGFGVAAASGLLMFAGQANELLSNRAFMSKMGLVALAGINAAVFHARGSLHKLDAAARAQTALSLGLWILVMICGRWIAY